MKIEDTADLEGCEIICIGEQETDLISCPLSKEEQATCKQRRQYEAGEKAIMDWVSEHMMVRSYVYIPSPEVKAKFKELGIKLEPGI